MTIDFDLKLKALDRLAVSRSAEADAALKREVDKASATLLAETRYAVLEHQLKILKSIAFRASQEAAETLREFVGRVQSIEIAYSVQESILGDEIKKYRNAASLTVDAIDVLVGLRYLQTKVVVGVLMDLSLREDGEVRKHALRGLEELASYKINVIYGDGNQPGIGFTPQQRVLGELDQLTVEQLQEFLPAIATLTTNILSLTMEQTTWSYKEVSFTRGEVPAASDLADIRLRTIELLKRVYVLVVSNNDKMRVLGALSAATARPNIGQKREASVPMMERDALNVLHFYRSLLSRESLPIVQKLEQRSYWIFYHAITVDVAKAARDVEVAISTNAEYQIYKTLIGSEGVFGDWQQLKDDKEIRAGTDEFRKGKAREFATNIAPDNYDEWRQRILKFAETKSDDLATFRVFHYFLGEVAGAQPKFAFELLFEYTEELKLFLIPLIRTLSGGPEKQAVEALIGEWILAGQNLYPSIKQYLSNDQLNSDLLTRLLERAIELDDMNAIIEVISVAVSNYHPDKKFLIDRFFLPALQALTERSNADWIFDAWYRRETKALIGDLDADGRTLVLKNLRHLKKIDYHAEEILYLIAEDEPQQVVAFLFERLGRENEEEGLSRSLYDAVPFELHKLKEPLSKVPRYAVEAARANYDGNYGLFILRGAHVLGIIFPDFSEAFEAELLRVLAGKNEGDILFVLAVLRNYEGEPFIHRICKEIIRILPVESRLRTEVAVALESTGVVSGEFGFAEAYERKMEEMKDWLDDPDERIKEFARWYLGTLEAMSATERKRAAEDIALRKQKYGE